MNARLDTAEIWLKLAQEANWSIATLARNRGVSRRTLERRFRESLGQCPRAWMAEHRQKQAAKLLLEGYSIKETAARLGYTHPSTFCREFKKRWGCRSMEFLAMIRSRPECPLSQKANNLSPQANPL